MTARPCRVLTLRRKSFLQDIVPVHVRARCAVVISAPETCCRITPMKNDFEEKMADIMIGEAVTALLDEDVAISWAVLTERLRAAIEHETDEDRVRAGLRAIEEVRREMQIRAGEKIGVPGAYGLSAQKLH